MSASVLRFVSLSTTPESFPPRGERGREPYANGVNDRDLLDYAFLRSVTRVSSVEFRVPPTKVLELGCGVCGP